METWEQFRLNPNLQKALKNLNFEAPTPVQTAFIPVALAGKDVIGIAQTGTGKTAAYLLPILMKIRCAADFLAPRAVILVPTKELVKQVSQHAQDLIQGTDIRIVALYGGVGPQEQLEKVKSGADILIATPGRFLEIYSLQGFSPKKIQVLVLDEADRMLDAKFRPQLYDILEILPTRRQNFLLSATYPEKMEKITQDFLEFPIRVEVTPQATAAKNVTQYAYALPNFMSKIYFLERLLQDENLKKVLIFVRTRANADNIYKFIGRKTQRKVKVLHANKAQNTRLKALEDFKNDEIDVLVSTDVAARGIDITAVTHVINFEVPLNDLEYIHRIGRTGRAFALGTSITFANKVEKLHLARIEKTMGKKIEFLNLPEDFICQETPKKEIIEIEREIDALKRRENPDFLGAFHEKKKRIPKQRKSEKEKKNQGKKIVTLQQKEVNRQIAARKHQKAISLKNKKK